jgi:hypothetical protein
MDAISDIASVKLTESCAHTPYLLASKQPPYVKKLKRTIAYHYLQENESKCEEKSLDQICIHEAIALYLQIGAVRSVSRCRWNALLCTSSTQHHGDFVPGTEAASLALFDDHLVLVGGFINSGPTDRLYSLKISDDTNLWSEIRLEPDDSDMEELENRNRLVNPDVDTLEDSNIDGPNDSDMGGFEDVDSDNMNDIVLSVVKMSHDELVVRYGHSMTKVDSSTYVFFGGLQHAGYHGDSNDLYILRREYGVDRTHRKHELVLKWEAAPLNDLQTHEPANHSYQ